MKYGHTNRAKSAQIAKQRADEKLRFAVKSKRILEMNVTVNRHRLRPTNSYGIPEFVRKGYYVDKPFICKSCGVKQIWTAVQQQWWYEVIQGDVWTTAVRCRACRRQERLRKAAARRIHLAGLAQKAFQQRMFHTGALSPIRNH